jgi:hypothetical protein
VSTPFDASEQSDAPAPSPFHRLSDFLALPRLGGLALSADGTRLVVSVSTLDAEKKKYQSALWEIDPSGGRARRVVAGLAARRLPAVHLVPARAGCEGERRPEAGAVEPSGRRW